jgi:hypothetical protein
VTTTATSHLIARACARRQRRRAVCTPRIEIGFGWHGVKTDADHFVGWRSRADEDRNATADFNDGAFLAASVRRHSSNAGAEAPFRAIDACSKLRTGEHHEGKAPAGSLLHKEPSLDR